MGQETVLEGAVRELHEECGAVVNPEDLREVAKIVFNLAA